MLNSLNFDFKRKVPVILQTETSECGLACIAMILGYYNGNANLFSLRRQYDISSRGATLQNLVDISEKLGLFSRPLSLELEEIQELKLPCILHWDFNHFVVLTKVSDKHCWIHDPAFGKKKLLKSELSKHFTGIALEVWSNVSFQKEKDRDTISLYETFKNITGVKGALIKIFSLSVIIEAVNILLPVGMQLITDHIMHAKDKSLLLVICLGLFLFTLFRSLMSMARGWISLKINYLIDFQWTASFFTHLIKLPLEFFEKRQAGDIQSRFNSLRTIQSTLTKSTVTIIIDSIMIICLIIMMSLYGGWLIWIIIGFFIIYLFLRVVTYLVYRQITEEHIVKQAKSTSHFMETLYGITTLKSLGIERKRREHWMSLNAEAFNLDIKIHKFDMLFSGIHTFISSLEQILVLGIGAMLVIDNTFTLGMFVAFNSYRGYFSERSESLINTIFDLKMLSLHRERIVDVALTEKEYEYTEYNEISNMQEASSIMVDNIVFQYDKFSQPIINKLSLNIYSGESVAISAPSGFGKTTLLKLMAGLLNPTSGKIYFNHTDIHQIGVANYRKQIACVLQDDTFFSGSIMENIVSFEEKYDQDFAIECAKVANIHDEITSMPMGYETLLGELGNNLSGGQKQRLLIARALYRKPKILFMDEATSHLDEENERAINEAVSRLNITRVIVAHRKSTIESADRVIELTRE